MVDIKILLIIIHILGADNLQVELHPELSKTHRFLVAKLPGKEIILGTDFLKLCGPMEVNLESKYLRFGHVVLDFVLKNDSQPSVFILGDIDIPARTEVVFSAAADVSPLSLGVTYVFEPIPRLTDFDGLLAARVCVQPYGKIIPIRCINTSNRDIRLYQDMTIGTLEPICPDRIMKVDFGTGGGDELRLTVITRETELIESARAFEVDLSKSDLTFEQQAELLDVLDRNKDVFSLSDSELGCCPYAKHIIPKYP